uniref:Phosphatidylinositol-4-phosphate 3-kinase, catalytic subunit type 2 alpha n=1 Tax=Gadus morhua TaxID=8049 RepID=A0A8C4ZB75_GADMO
MAQTSSGNGFKLDVPQPKGIVGKEEALRMEEEAMAKCQKEKQHSLSASSRLSSSTKKPAGSDKFSDIDVEKLTNEELEKLLLDDNFGTSSSKATRPSSLLGFNLSASYPGGHACSHSPFQTGPWTPVISTTSGSGVSTPTNQQAPLFPSAPFPKPVSFQNGFPPGMSPFMGLTAPQPSFMGFTPIQTAAPLVYQQPPVDPVMARLFDKIASTSEYLKNGRLASMDVDSAPGPALSPAHPAAAEEPTTVSHFEWLDLDPLTRRRDESEETAGGRVTAAGDSAGDPWDAVLETEGSRGSSSPTSEAKPPLSTQAQPRRASTGPSALQEPEAQNLEAVAFCTEVAMLRSRFPHGDVSTNPGYILSPVIPQRDGGGDGGCSVKVSIEISDFQEPVTFTCDVSSPVELLVSQTLCWVHDDLDQVDFSCYLLKVCGQEEVLQNKHSLGSHEYVQNCRKWESEIRLQLLSQSTMRRDLARTVRPLGSRSSGQSSCCEYLYRHKQTNTHAHSNISSRVLTFDPPAGNGSPVQEGMAQLTEAVYDLARLYLRLLRPRGAPPSATPPPPGTTDQLQFTVFALHGIPAPWISSYEKYYLTCSLTHNGRNLFKPVQSKKVGTYKSFFLPHQDGTSCKTSLLTIIFPMAVAVLPLESVLSLSVFGLLNQNATSSPDSNRQRKGPELLGKVSLALFDFHSRPPHTPMCQPPVDFPSPSAEVLYVGPPAAPSPEPDTLEELDPDLRRKLEKICSRASTFGLKRADYQLLWDQRLYCRRDHPSSLPKVLAGAPSWDWASLAHIHSLLHLWAPLAPVTALELLDAKFADTEVRRVAVGWIEVSTDDELADYLPQLVQVMNTDLKWMEIILPSQTLNAVLSLSCLCGHQSLTVKPCVCCPLQAAEGRTEDQPGAALRAGAGGPDVSLWAGLRAEPTGRPSLVNLLAGVAERVRQAGGFCVALQEGLENVQTFFQRNSCRLPLSPSLVAKELNIKACSFFNSNAVPLKLALVNADPLGEEINVMYKVGEDLRQDMLALQMIRIMDRIWLQEGLDLRMVNFKCISTGKDKGMVELVPSSDTLRKIQVEYGVTGSFKDKPLAEWLRKYNPAEDEYDKASEELHLLVCWLLRGHLCAPASVDRHNDNIMLRSSGHMFHIDFGKFLGHARCSGASRDRAPFVLTSDMAYVINGGERPTSRFQLFVDLCSQAYNLIRKHSGLFLNLLSLMTSSGLPELSGSQDLKYVFDALQPHTTDAEATIFFTRLIESSLGSMATKFNFFIHNLAQLRFSGLPASDEPILSFSPRTYSLKQDGRVMQASIFSFQKRYSPDKHYTYVVRLLREGQNEPQFVFRTFDEFQELHSKLSILFPLWKLPSFPNKMVLGRTHIKEVASKRKLELNNYVHNLLRSSTEVTQCDLIYTFYHPVARDDKTEGSNIVSPVPEPPLSPTGGRVEGEVKVSVSYRNSNLFIMVMHIRDLVSEDGTDPNPYVKTYLLPDPHKTSKRKTKITRKTRNPTFNEMLVYSGYSKETLGLRELQLSVLSAESLRENFFLGGITLRLKEFDLSKETVKWHKLTAVPYF